ncbi:MAG: hypothetical protein N2450_07740 [bacterium]|nr:hypothetical protein [bacterium]
MNLHVELRTTDLAATGKFLQECLHWVVESWEWQGETYLLFKDRYDNPVIGGDVEAVSTLPEVPTCVVYCPCENIEQTVDAALKHGATIFRPIMNVGDYGLKIVILKLPGGCHLGFWWSPKQDQS